MVAWQDNNKGETMTTEQKHTPEPWAYSVNVGPTKGLIVESDGSTILEVHNTLRDSRFERNLRRIVACVNYCQGIQTLEIERAPENLQLRHLLAMIDNDLPVHNANVETLKQQRDELARSLRDMVHYDDLPTIEQTLAMARARAALAKLS